MLYTVISILAVDFRCECANNQSARARALAVIRNVKHLRVTCTVVCCINTWASKATLLASWQHQPHKVAQKTMHPEGMCRPRRYVQLRLINLLPSRQHVWQYLFIAPF